MRVAVCVPTYQRPKGLRRLLSALGGLEFRGNPPGIEIIVVDNDVKRSAEAVCEQARAEKKLRWAFRYCVEPRRGLASVRNAALREALPGNDFIVFIDDDGVPHPQWLDELLAIQRVYRADVVTGPVLPHFIKPPPAWAIKGRVFEPWRYPIGRQVKVAYTSNVLIRTEVFRESGMWFDERLDLVGGEDHHMFRRVSQAGYKIIWADRALVHEWIPSNRTTIGWVLRRSFRTGNTLAFIHLDLRPALSNAARLLGWGIFGAFVGAGVLASGLLRGPHAMVNGARYLTHGAGIITGVGGMRYHGYRTTDGE